jgi:putative ABC transport system substrate-binding protein
MLTLGTLQVPLAADAQQAGKIYHIGYLTAAGGVEQSFRDAMRQLGYLEGQSIVIEGRFAEWKLERLPDLAAELVGLKVDVIVTITTPAAQAAKNATATIPIVMAGSADPVKLGLVASLAHPGGNTTAMTFEYPELAGKRLELLKELAPGMRRVLVLYDPRDASPRQGVTAAREAAPKLGFTLVERETRSLEEIRRALDALGEADALLAIPGGLPSGHSEEMIRAANKRKRPTMFHARTKTTTEALASYGASDVAIARQAARLIDKILKGAKAGDLPVERPTKLDLVINLKIANALGLTIPQSVLIRADEVIQ